MPVVPVTSPDAPQLGVYRHLREQNLTRHSRRFIAEGNKLVERLLTSPFPTESIFAAEDYVDKLLPLVPADVPVYVAPRNLLEETIGFNFHRGCLACGVRQPVRQLAGWEPAGATTTIVVCPDVQDPTNLGTVLRNCAAFGVELVLLGDKCADPFSRRVLRVSMGTVLGLTIVEATDLAKDVQQLRERFGVQTFATVLDRAAESLEDIAPAPRVALFFGSEGHGLSSAWSEQADHRVTIPMQLGTDSLNVAVASGIFLNHFTRRRT
jgi:tRNA G18 (ribose-2'-O)-methylase SpoU